MKQRLTDEFINAVLPFVDRRHIDDIKMKTAMILSKYSIAEESTELTVYKGDVNDKMLKRFLMAKAAAGLSPRTLRYYRISITFFFNRINKPYCDITADDIRLYIATRTQIDKVSKVTADNERRNISSFYTWLQKEEILLKNPMTKVDSIKIPKKKKNGLHTNGYRENEIRLPEHLPNGIVRNIAFNMGTRFRSRSD